MKIAVQWPDSTELHSKTKEALALWECVDELVVLFSNGANGEWKAEVDCELVEIENGPPVVESCYIPAAAMLRALVEKHPTEDWYGFARGDIVPVAHPTNGLEKHDVLIFHRTEIAEWEDRFAGIDHYEPVAGDMNIHRWIWMQRNRGVPERTIANALNAQGIQAPDGSEWNVAMIRAPFPAHERICICNQGMYLFRNDVVDRVLMNIANLRRNDGLWDLHLSRYLFDNFDAKRVFRRVFQKSRHAFLQSGMRNSAISRQDPVHHQSFRPKLPLQAQREKHGKPAVVLPMIKNYLRIHRLTALPLSVN